MIQCNWRCYRDRSGYHRYKCARVLQSAWRGYNTFCSYRDYKGATRIQTAWRGFQAYTDYVFALVDILIIQRSLRRWIATKQVEALRRERAALVLQTVWRRHSSQKLMLVDIMHIIVVQVRFFMIPRLVL
jgi:myosin-5